MESDNGLLWVDLLKFFGLIFVILGHINSPFSKFIYSWHPTVSGLLSGLQINQLIKQWAVDRL